MAKIESSAATAAIIKEPVVVETPEPVYVYTGEKNYEPPKVDPWVIEENK